MRRVSWVMGLNTRIKIKDDSSDWFEVYVSCDRSRLSFECRGQIVYITTAEARELAEYLNARADEIDVVQAGA